MLGLFQSALRRLGRPLALVISATVALGFAGLYNQLPPLQPMVLTLRMAGSLKNALILTAAEWSGRMSAGAMSAWYAARIPHFRRSGRLHLRAPMADVTSVVSGTGKAIGRYFSVVSVPPSILLVIYVFLLASSGGLEAFPELARCFHRGTQSGIVGASMLAVSGLAVGLVLHPLQFGMVQVLEGYWGPGWLAQQIRVSQIVAIVDDDCGCMTLWGKLMRLFVKVNQME